MKVALWILVFVGVLIVGSSFLCGGKNEARVTVVQSSLLHLRDEQDHEKRMERATDISQRLTEHSREVSADYNMLAYLGGAVSLVAAIGLAVSASRKEKSS